MASFAVTGRLDKDKPNLRFVPDNGAASQLVGTNLWDWFDETNRRYNSGVVSVTVTSIAAADGNAGPTGGIFYNTGGGSTLTGSETVQIGIQPPSFNALNDGQYVNSGATVQATILSASPIYKNICAVNYGMPGPSAFLSWPDGTISFTAIDLALSSNALTDITSAFTVTVSGTLTATGYSTRTNYDPYADNGGTAYTLDLVSGPLSAKLFLAAAAGGGGPYQGKAGVIGCPVQSAQSAVVLQLTNVTTVYIPGAGGPPSRWPRLMIQNPAQAGGQRICNVNLPICLEGQKTLVFHDAYTWVYAINAPVSGGVAVDANATQIGLVDLAAGNSPAYNLANAWIEQAPDDTGTVACVLKYKVKVNSVA